MEIDEETKNYVEKEKIDEGAYDLKFFSPAVAQLQAAEC